MIDKMLFRLEYGRFDFLLMWWIYWTEKWEQTGFWLWYNWRCWLNPRFPEIWLRFRRREDAHYGRILELLAKKLGCRLIK